MSLVSSRFMRRSITACLIILPAAIALPMWNSSGVAPFKTAPIIKKTAGQTRVAQNKPVEAGGVLLTYQTALDQIAQNHWLEARVLLQDGIRRLGDQHDLNLLLAYVLEHEGRKKEARQVLAQLKPRSPVATVYLSRLQDGKTPDDNQNATSQSNADPSRSPVADLRLARLEKLMRDLINAERRKSNLSTLEWSDDLAEVSRAHSVEMRELKYFAHESPTKGLKAPFDRYVAGMGRTPRIVAENIYRYWGSRHEISDADVQTGHKALMDSPGHRANIMQRDVTRIGIGIAANANGDLWITQMFDKP